MDVDTALIGVRLGLACYALLLAVAAIVGLHRSLLAYPARISYSLLRLVVMLLSGGQVRLVPLGRRIKRRSLRRIRNLRSMIDEWREVRVERQGSTRTAVAMTWLTDDDRRKAIDKVQDQGDSPWRSSEPTGVRLPPPEPLWADQAPPAAKRPAPKKPASPPGPKRQPQEPPQSPKPKPKSPLPPRQPPQSPKPKPPNWDDDDDLPPVRPIRPGRR